MTTSQFGSSSVLPALRQTGAKQLDYFSNSIMPQHYTQMHTPNN